MDYNGQIVQAFWTGKTGRQFDPASTGRPFDFKMN